AASPDRAQKTRINVPLILKSTPGRLAIFRPGTTAVKSNVPAQCNVPGIMLLQISLAAPRRGRVSLISPMPSKLEAARLDLVADLDVPVGGFAALGWPIKSPEQSQW